MVMISLEVPIHLRGSIAGRIAVERKARQNLRAAYRFKRSSREFGFLRKQ
jgi:hypothetical protein